MQRPACLSDETRRDKATHGAPACIQQALDKCVGFPSPCERGSPVLSQPPARDRARVQPPPAATGCQESQLLGARASSAPPPAGAPSCLARRAICVPREGKGKLRLCRARRPRSPTLGNGLPGGLPERRLREEKPDSNSGRTKDTDCLDLPGRCLSGARRLPLVSWTRTLALCSPSLSTYCALRRPGARPRAEEPGPAPRRSAHVRPSANRTRVPPRCAAPGGVTGPSSCPGTPAGATFSHLGDTRPDRAWPATRPSEGKAAEAPGPCLGAAQEDAGWSPRSSQSGCGAGHYLIAKRCHWLRVRGGGGGGGSPQRLRKRTRAWGRLPAALPEPLLPPRSPSPLGGGSGTLRAPAEGATAAGGAGTSPARSPRPPLQPWLSGIPSPSSRWPDPGVNACSDFSASPGSAVPSLELASAIQQLRLSPRATARPSLRTGDLGRCQGSHVAGAGFADAPVPGSGGACPQLGALQIGRLRAHLEGALKGACAVPGRPLPRSPAAAAPRRRQGADFTDVKAGVASARREPSSWRSEDRGRAVARGSPGQGRGREGAWEATGTAPGSPGPSELAGLPPASPAPPWGAPDPVHPDHAPSCPQGRGQGFRGLCLKWCGLRLAPRRSARAAGPELPSAPRHLRPSCPRTHRPPPPKQRRHRRPPPSLQGPRSSPGSPWPSHAPEPPRGWVWLLGKPFPGAGSQLGGLAHGHPSTGVALASHPAPQAPRGGSEPALGVRANEGRRS
nr:collagen alpha-1(I) chain-like [Meriones unguiculatus]